MYASVLTQKGQTTIPKEVREILHLNNQDTIVYVPDGERVYLRVVKGSIADVAGAFALGTKKVVNFKKLRESVKAKVAKQIVQTIQ